MNFLNEISLAAMIWPDKIAIARGSGRVLTYQQVVAGAHAGVERLSRAGVRSGDIVSIEVSDPTHRILLTLALLMSGVCLVNAGSSADGRSPATSVALTSKPASGPPSAGLRTLLVDDQWFIGATAEARSQAGFAPGAPAVVWFTSGTTGRPKPVALSWARLDVKIGIRKSILGATNFDRVLIVPALSASFGMMTTLASLALGKSVFLVDYETDVFKIVSLFRVEYLVVSTYQLSKITEGAKSLAHDLSSTTRRSVRRRISRAQPHRRRARLCHSEPSQHLCVDRGGRGGARARQSRRYGPRNGGVARAMGGRRDRLGARRCSGARRGWPGPLAHALHSEAF